MLIHRKNSCCKTVSSSTTSGLGGLIISYQYKNTGFIDDLSDVRGVEIDASGYNLAITPASVDSKIRVMFRALVKTSDEAFSRVKFKISYDIGNTGLSWEELCSDINLGYTNRLAFYPDPLTSIYSVDTIHSPNTTQSINYKLSYQIEASGVDVLTSTPIGVLESSANSIILEELNGTGTTGLSTWSIGSGNTIYYNRSSVGIGVNTVDTNYVLDVSGNTRIYGNLDMSCSDIEDVSSISFCGGPTMSLSGGDIQLTNGTIIGLTGLGTSSFVTSRLIDYVHKTTGLPTDVSNVRNTPYIDASGYTLAITPSRADSDIRVMFRTLVQTSDEPFSRINFRILYDISDGVSGELCSDSLFGYTNKFAVAPDPLTSVYTVDTIHSPATINRITYRLQYYIEASGSDTITSTPIGVLESSANSIILEELNHGGTVDLSCGSLVDVSSITFCGGGPTLSLSGGDIQVTNGTIIGLSAEAIGGGGGGTTFVSGRLLKYQYKTTGLPGDLSNVRSSTEYIDASGYTLAITPSRADSDIRVMYRALVMTSDEPYSRIRFRIVYDVSGGVSGELCSDSLLGYTNELAVAPDPLTSIYTVDTLHTPATTDTITYRLQYQIELSGGDLLTSIPIGVLESSANSILLEELNDEVGLVNLGCGSLVDVSSITFCNGPSLTVSGNNIELSGGTINGLAGLLVNYEYNTQLSSDVSNIRGSYIDASGYSLSITPGSTQSKIRVMYRALVRSSDEPYSRISFRVLYDISGGVSGELCSDASYGFPNRLSLYPDPLTSIYTVDTIHSPATTDRITYSLQYSIESSGGDVSTSIPIGVLESSANSIILEELNGTGTTGPSIWTKGPSNTIYYIGGQVAINRQTPEAILDIQQAENADVSGNTSVISRGDAIKIRNSANTSDWIIACDSGASGSDLFILNENEQGGKIDGNEAPSNRFQDITFTGQHRSIYKSDNIENDIGLIVVSNNRYLNLDNTIEPTIDESLPIVVLANKDNDKQVFGVVSNIENQNYKSRIHNTGRFASYIQKYTVNERRVLINSLGEGGIWVCNKNGTLENGDYITSSSVIGYGVKQQDDILHNYTVAKITSSCDFNLNKIIKRKVNTIIDGDNNRQIVYTTDGDIEYVDDLDSLGNIQMVYKYDTRFLDVSGNIVNEGQHSYIACFVGCTYHCG